MMKLHMKYRKSTIGTVVFEEVAIDGSELAIKDMTVPSLYIRKTAMKAVPKRLTLTIEVAE